LLSNGCGKGILPLYRMLPQAEKSEVQVSRLWHKKRRGFPFPMLRPKIPLLGIPNIPDTLVDRNSGVEGKSGDADTDGNVGDDENVDVHSNEDDNDDGKEQHTDNKPWTKPPVLSKCKADITYVFLINLDACPSSIGQEYRLTSCK
jgi:hypothetical protein